MKQALLAAVAATMLVGGSGNAAAADALALRQPGRVLFLEQRPCGIPAIASLGAGWRSGLEITDNGDRDYFCYQVDGRMVQGMYHDGRKTEWLPLGRFERVKL